MRKLISFFLLNCLLLPIGFAQDQNANSVSSSEVSIIGSIKEASTGNPLGFATISFYSTKDSSLIAGGLSEADGTFHIDTKHENLFAIVEFIGFEPIKIDPVLFEGNQLEDKNP